MFSQLSSWWYQSPKEPPKTSLQRPFTHLDLDKKKLQLKSPVFLNSLGRSKPTHLPCTVSNDLLDQIKSIHLRKINIPPRINTFPPRSLVLQELLSRNKVFY